LGSIRRPHKQVEKPRRRQLPQHGVPRHILLILFLTVLIDSTICTRWPDCQPPPSQRLSSPICPTRFPTHKRHRSWGAPPCSARYSTAIGSTATTTAAAAAAARTPTNAPARRSPTASRPCPPWRPASPRNRQWRRSSHAPWCWTQTSRRSRSRPRPRSRKTWPWCTGADAIHYAWAPWYGCAPTPTTTTGCTTSPALRPRSATATAAPTTDAPEWPAAGQPAKRHVDHLVLRFCILATRPAGSNYECCRFSRPPPTVFVGQRGRQGALRLLS
jgi:hypothetical protein